MKTFIYKAKNGPEEIIEGRILASNAEDAVAKLIKKGHIATYIKEETAETAPRHRYRRLFRTSQKELIFFTRQLASLLKAGIPVLRALRILSEQTTDRYFKQVISEIGENIEDGQALHASLKEYPKIFSSFYTAMVKTGEDSGRIDESLRRIYEYYAKQAQVLSRVKSALAYPTVIMIAGIGTIVFVFTNVIPRVIPLLVNLDTKLPVPTQILLSVSAFIRNEWMWMALGAVIFILIFNRALINKVFRRYCSSLKLNMPIMGRLIARSELARFMRALEISSQSGVPLIKAITISLPIIREEFIRGNLQKSLKELETGRLLSEAFESTSVIPLYALNLIRVGEESGNMTRSFSEIADVFEAECTDAIDYMVHLLEPLMMLVIGLIVWFIVSAVLLPIFQLNMIQL